MDSKKQGSTQSSSSTTYSELKLSGKMIDLKSSCSVMSISQTYHTTPEVITFPCDVLKDQLVKCFQISFQGTLIVVEDKISFGSLFSNLENYDKNSVQNRTNNTTKNKNSIKKKMVIFKNNFSKNRQYQGKSDKKNIVKNIVNAFVKYLKEGNPEDQTLKNIIKTAESFIQALKFNNRLIAAIIKNHTTRQYFRQFLGTGAVEWIQKSKVKGKQIYQKAIRIYEQLCMDKERQIKADNKESTPNRNESNVDNSLCLRDLENYDLQEEIRGFN